MILYQECLIWKD